MEGWNLATVNYQLTDTKTLRGHHGSALSHIQSGVKILSEVAINDHGEQNHGVLMTSPHPFVHFWQLEILFNRLDAQTSQVCLRSLPSFLTLLHTLSTLTFRACTIADHIADDWNPTDAT